MQQKRVIKVVNMPRLYVMNRLDKISYIGNTIIVDWRSAGGRDRVEIWRRYSNRIIQYYDIIMYIVKIV
jgi:hypothetical protein